MTVPVLITVPFGDANDEKKSDEREAFEQKVIDTMLQDLCMDDLAFYQTFYFYPYKNPNARGEPLTPQQLYEVLKNELDFFLPELNTIEDLRREFNRGNRSTRIRKYTHPFVPAHKDKTSGEDIVGPEDKVEWESQAYVLIIDDLESVWGRLIYMEEYNCRRRLYRKFYREGQSDVWDELKEEDELIYLKETNASDMHMQDGKLQLQDDYFLEENRIASEWLGLSSPRDSYWYSISASFMKLIDIPTNVANLQTGNLEFEQLMPDEETIQEAAQEVQQSLSKLNGN